MDSLPFAQTLIACGLAGIVGLTAAEKFVPILPSYVMLIFLGMTVVTHPASLVLTIVAATIGSTVGALGWYGIGRAIGGFRVERLVNRFGRLVFLSPELYRKLSEAYRRHHFWVTLIGQTIPTARIYLALPAGVIGLAFPGFLTATVIGTLVWNAPLITVGYLLRDSGADPLTIGAATLGIILAVEGTILVALKLGRGRRRVAGRG